MKDQLEILIIEDSIQDYLILKEYINRIDAFSVKLTHRESLNSLDDLLDKKFDLIFLDLFLEDSFGRNSFLKLKSLVVDIPIVVISGLTDKNIAVEIVKLGAQEYIVKGDFDELLIEKAITYSIERHRFQNKLQESEQRHKVTFKNAGVALGEYDAHELYDYVNKLKSSGLKSPKDIQIDNLNDARIIRSMIRLVGVNDEAIRLFEMDSERDFHKNHMMVHTEASIVIFKKLVEAIWNESDSFKIITKYVTKSNRPLVLLSRVTLFGYEKGTCQLIKSGTDITTLVRKEQIIAKQIDLAESLANSTLAMLGEGDASSQLENALKLQAKTFESDLVLIFEFEHRNGVEYLKSDYHWLANEGEDNEKIKWLYNTSIDDLKIRQYQTDLEKGKFIELNVSEITPENESQYVILKRLGLKSLLVAPVFVKNVMQNAVAYASFTNDKFWQDEELITVKSFCNAIGSFVVKNRAESELKELNAQLEDRITQRTEDLTEAMAELESFSYSVSHDLRAPLRKVGGFSQILDKEFGGTLPERARHLLKNIKEGATEMSELIHDLLEFSKLGRQPISFQEVDMNGLAKEIVTNAEQMFTNLNLDLVVEPLQPAEGDRNLLKHALSNLVFNAIKFSSKNEKIEVRIKSEVHNGMTDFSIVDNGIGIDMDYADKIFNVFHRLHTKDEYEGTGVGLAIVKRIVKKHNGHINVKGELGKGTTFTLSLPSSKNQIPPVKVKEPETLIPELVQKS